LAVWHDKWNDSYCLFWGLMEKKDFLEITKKAF
jgi:hypothetical protein